MSPRPCTTCRGADDSSSRKELREETGLVAGALQHLGSFYADPGFTNQKLQTLTTSNGGQCPCGTATFAIDGPPLFRMLCHCTICQAYNDAPFADVTAFRARHVHLIDEASVAFRAWRQPPLVQRGRCVRCEAAALERVRLPVMPHLTLVPSANVADGSRLPVPEAHIFYASRVADADDGLPKHAGFVGSQIAFAKALLGGLRKARDSSG